MIDTLNLLNKDLGNLDNHFEKLPNVFTESFGTHKKYGNYTKYNLKDNLKIQKFDTGVSIYSSMPKYAFGGLNAILLNYEQTKDTLNSISNDLELDLSNFTITRIDYSENIFLEKEPNKYLPLLLNLGKTYRNLSNGSLTYKTKKYSLLFYDKKKEMRAKKHNIPSSWNSENIMRIEYQKRLPLGNTLHQDQITVSKFMETDKHYLNLHNEMLSKYSKVNKMNTPLDLENPTFSELCKSYFIQHIEKDGLDNVLARIDLIYSDRKKKYRTKQSVRNLVKRKKLTKENDLVKELTEKINSIKPT